MPKVSDLHQADRRDQSLSAAAACFAAQGFHATSMADVVKASGLSAGSVYRYFASKDDLIGAIIDRYLEGLVGHFAQAHATSDSPADTVIDALRLFTQGLQGTPFQPFAQLMPQFWSEVRRNETIRKRGETAFRSLLGQFADIVKRAQGAGTLSSDLEPSGVAQIMLALVQGFFLQSILLGQDAALEVYAETVRRLLSPISR